IEIPFEMPTLKKWEMIGATALTNLKLRAPFLKSLQLSECSVIENIATSSNALSVLDIQGCKLLDSCGLMELVVPEAQSQVRHVILANTKFPKIIQCCPLALFLRYHPPQNNLLNEIEQAYSKQIKTGDTSKQCYSQQYKFAKSVEDIFLNEDPPIIVQYLTEINSSGEDDDANQCILNQLKIALKHESSVIRVKAAHAVRLRLGYPRGSSKDIKSIKTDYIGSRFERCKFGYMQKSGKKNVNDWISSSYRTFRLEVIRALGSFGSAAATHAILYQLAETLKDTDVDIRLETANTLGLFGPAAATEKVLHRLV
ncbi:hypothetical protein RFI_20566, partial [Reticulomyxa filosa]